MAKWGKLTVCSYLQDTDKLVTPNYWDGGLLALGERSEWVHVNQDWLQCLQVITC